MSSSVMACATVQSIPPSKRHGCAAACRHCGDIRTIRCRGLGWQCFYTPAVREQSPWTSNLPPRGAGCGDGRLPDRPTRALPGSPAKVAVLETRAFAGQALWHPDDRQFTDAAIRIAALLTDHPEPLPVMEDDMSRTNGFYLTDL